MISIEFGMNQLRPGSYPMAEIQHGIVVQQGITIGPVPVYITTTYFVTEVSEDELITESGQQFVTQ